MDPIITRMDDEDFYKLTMWWAVRQHYPLATAKTRLIIRDETNLAFLKDELRNQIDHLGDLKVQDDTLDFLSHIYFLGEPFVEEFKDYRLDPRQIDISIRDNQLHVESFGRWQNIMGFECKILAIISELYTKLKYELSDEAAWEIAKPRLQTKCDNFKKYPRLQIAEFAFRRRSCKYVQDNGLELLKDELRGQLIGVSNVWLAMKYGITPIGTMAHEYIQAHLALSARMRNAQKMALHTWLQTYDKDLGIALPDTFTSDAFFKDFGHVLSQMFSGVRHDSGDPYVFGNKAILHYQMKGIDPLTKTIVFSDGLDDEQAIQIWKCFVGLIRIVFGIGTNISNDLGGLYPALRIVMKMIECNGKPVVKLSDVEGKVTGDLEMVREVRKVFGA